MKTVLVLLFCVVSCLARYNPQPRIVGGQIAYEAEFPYTAALYVSTESGTFFCTGALIDEEWILTTGNCADGADLFTILLGTTKLGSTQDSVLAVTATEYELHPDFNADTLENDVALIHLDKPVTYTTRIRPAFLPESPLKESDAGQVLGWGKTKDADSGLTNVLNYVTLWALSDEDCKAKYGDQIVGNLACFVGDEKQGTCQGDSGSPIIQHLINGHTVVIGISSFVSKNGCESGDPSGFTKVFEYVDWIQTTIM